MQKLAAGIHRFRSEYFQSKRGLFEKLSKQGQHPETLFVTCSDSRVVPELITSASPGELFIVRNVGNIVPPLAQGVIGGVAAAVEYAVCVLGVTGIVVCGHTQCGAMETLFRPELTRGLRFVPRWLDQASGIPRLIQERYGSLDPEQRMNAAVQENVLEQVENLRGYDFIADRLDQGKLHVSAWVFRIATGTVFEYDPATEQFQPVGADDEVPLPSRRLTDPPAPVDK